MKIARYLLSLLLIAGPMSAQTVIFQDDFETQDFSAWSYITAGSPLTISANGVISTAQVHSGLYSFAATLPATGNAVKTAQALSNLTEVYYQVWLYIDPAFTMTDALSVMSVTGGGQVMLRQSSGTIYLKTYAGVNGTHSLSKGAWHSIQLHDLAGSGTAVESVILDGTLDINSTGGTIAGPFTAAFIGPNNADATQSGVLYFDDAQVATGGALTAPSASITVRYPNTNARTAFPVDVTMWGTATSDILTASVDSSTVYTQTGSMTNHQRFLVSISSLSVGSHTFQVQLQNSGGTPKATFTGSFTTYLSGTPTVAIDGNNNLFKSGSPFFFVAPFIDGSSQWSNPWLSNSSVNTYGWQDCFVAAYAYTPTTFNSCMNTVAYPFIGPDNNWTGRNGANGAAGDAANQPGAVATATGYVTADKGNSNLLFWTWVDEPDVGPSPGDVSPATVLSLSQAVWSNDGNHPVLSNLAGYPPSTTRDRQASWYYPIIPNSAAMPADIYAADMYPIIYQYNPWYVTQMVAVFDWEQRYTYNLVPWTAFIELGPCAQGACTGYGPTASQATMEAWLGVIHNLKGISWWGPAGWTTQDSAHWTAAANFVSTSTHFASAIESTTTRTVASNQQGTLGQDARVDAAVREDSTNIYVFAARLTDWNESGSPLSTTLTVSGTPSGTASVYGESRNVTVSSGVLTDTFNDSGVHIYVLPKGSSSSYTSTYSGGIVLTGVTAF